MATKKKMTAEAVSAPEKSDASKTTKNKDKESLEKAWGALRFLLKQAEIHWGVDLDKDGKIGSMRIGPMLLTATVALLVCIAPVFATTHSLVDWTAGSAWSAGTAKIEFNDSTSDCLLTVDDLTILDDFIIAGDLDIQGDIILENDETIDNAVDAQVRITADDNAVTLLDLKLTSDNANSGMADNDLIEITATAYPSNAAAPAVEIGGVQFVFTDVTSNSTDSAVNVRGLTAGTLANLAAFEGTTLTLKNGATLDNSSTALLTITEATVAIAGNGTVSGTLVVTGAADLNANSTATNVTFDTGSTTYIQDLRLGLTIIAGWELND